MKMSSSCSGSESFALQVLGKDMEDEFPEKCIIIIQNHEEKIPNSYVLVEVEGIKWFRQYKIDSDGREYLHACNEIYPDIELDGIEWKILGFIHQRNIRGKIKFYDYSAKVLN